MGDFTLVVMVHQDETADFSDPGIADKLQTFPEGAPACHDIIKKDNMPSFQFLSLFSKIDPFVLESMGTFLCLLLYVIIPFKDGKIVQVTGLEHLFEVGKASFPNPLFAAWKRKENGIGKHQPDEGLEDIKETTGKFDVAILFVIHQQ